MRATKIVILRMREIIYTAVFVGLGILLLILLFFMFWPDKSEGKQDLSAADQGEGVFYEAGIYTSELQIGDAVVNLQVALDEDHVKSVELINLDDSVATMYPLMEPSVGKISEQLAAGSSLDEIVLPEESQYTQELILGTVGKILEENQLEQ